MGRPRLETTNIHRILVALSKKDQSTQELAETLNAPLGTSRSTLSILSRMGFTESVPLMKRGKGFKPETAPGKRRGKKFRLTEKGREQLKVMQQEAT